MAEKNGNEKGKEMTPRDIAEQTLKNEFFRKTVGANFGMSNPLLFGQLGAQGIQAAYAQVTGSEDFNRARYQEHGQRKQQYAAAGIYGTPSVPTDADVVYGIANHFETSKGYKTLGELSELSGGVIKVEGRLAGISRANLLEKALGKDGKLDLSRLSELESDAIKMYGLLDNALSRKLALDVADFYIDLKVAGEEIQSKYKPVEPKEGEATKPTKPSRPQGGKPQGRKPTPKGKK